MCNYGHIVFYVHTSTQCVAHMGLWVDGTSTLRQVLTAKGGELLWKEANTHTDAANSHQNTISYTYTWNTKIALKFLPPAIYWFEKITTFAESWIQIQPRTSQKNGKAWCCLSSKEFPQILKLEALSPKSRYNYTCMSNYKSVPST